jgi:hypothetical protein
MIIPVSQNVTLIILLSPQLNACSINSTPIVAREFKPNLPDFHLIIIEDLPTVLSPIIITINIIQKKMKNPIEVPLYTLSTILPFKLPIILFLIEN